MYKIDEDKTIHVTRGDALLFDITAKDANGDKYTFVSKKNENGETISYGDVVRIKVYKKRKPEEVVISKDFLVTRDTDRVQIYLSAEDTKIGSIIGKPTTYWYEIELNPDTNDTQTIIGYDEDGPKLFVLYPEGAEGDEYG